MKTKLLLIGPAPFLDFNGTIKIKSNSTTLQSLKEKLTHESIETVGFLKSDILSRVNKLLHTEIPNTWEPETLDIHEKPHVQLKPGESCLAIDDNRLKIIEQQLENKSIRKKDLMEQTVKYRIIQRIE